MMENIGESRCVGGRQLRYSHAPEVLGCEMNFSIYLPLKAEQGNVQVLCWLSDVTCIDENFVAKAGAQRYAAKQC